LTGAPLLPAPVLRRQSALAAAGGPDLWGDEFDRSESNVSTASAGLSAMSSGT